MNKEKKKEDYMFIGYIEFNSFYCPKCDQSKDIFCGYDSYREKKHICHCCGAVYELDPKSAILNDTRLEIPMKFLHFVCEDCKEIIVIDKFSLCKKCKKDRANRIKRRIELSKETLRKMEASEDDFK